MSHPRLRRSRGLVVLGFALAVGLAACGGGDGDDSGDGDPAGSLDPSQYELRVSRCDAFRAEGTLTNNTGGPAAFEITAEFKVEGDLLPLQSTTTDVLADGESDDFSIAQDVTGELGASCEIISVSLAEGAPTADDPEDQDARSSSGGVFVTVGSNGTIRTSTDGRTWSDVDSGTSSALIDIAYAEGMFVAVGGEGMILTSTDGTDWSAVDSGTDEQLTRVAFAPGTWEAESRDSILTSSDGQTWTSRADDVSYTPSFNDVHTVVDDGSSRRIAVVAPGTPGAADGALLVSDGGGPWEVIETSGDYVHARDLARDGDGLWVAVGGNNEGRIVTSPDLERWTAQDTEYLAHQLWGVAHDGSSRWVAVGEGGVVYTSTDGREWEVAQRPDQTFGLLSVAFGE